MTPPLLKKISGMRCIKILSKHFGFRMVRQSGSHIILKKETVLGECGTVVPNHPELKISTLKKLLKYAGVTEEEFAKYQ